MAFRLSLRRLLQKDKREGSWGVGRRFGFKGRTREFVEFLGEDGHEYARQRLEQYAKTTRGKWQISEAGLTSIAKWITDYAQGRVPGYQDAVDRAVHR